MNFQSLITITHGDKRHMGTIGCFLFPFPEQALHQQQYYYNRLLEQTFVSCQELKVLQHCLDLNKCPFHVPSPFQPGVWIPCCRFIQWFCQFRQSWYPSLDIGKGTQCAPKSLNILWFFYLSELLYPLFTNSDHSLTNPAPKPR